MSTNGDQYPKNIVRSFCSFIDLFTRPLAHRIQLNRVIDFRSPFRYIRPNLPVCQVEHVRSTTTRMNVWIRRYDYTRQRDSEMFYQNLCCHGQCLVYVYLKNIKISLLCLWSFGNRALHFGMVKRAFHILVEQTEISSHYRFSLSISSSFFPFSSCFAHVIRRQWIND